MVFLSQSEGNKDIAYHWENDILITIKENNFGGMQQQHSFSSVKHFWNVDKLRRLTGSFFLCVAMLSCSLKSLGNGGCINLAAVQKDSIANLPYHAVRMKTIAEALCWRGTDPTNIERERMTLISISNGSPYGLGITKIIRSVCGKSSSLQSRTTTADNFRYFYPIWKPLLKWMEKSNWSCCLIYLGLAFAFHLLFSLLLTSAPSLSINSNGNKTIKEHHLDPQLFIKLCIWNRLKLGCNIWMQSFPGYHFPLHFWPYTWGFCCTASPQ